MKGLKIIPMFLILILLSFVGALFVEANRESVVIHLWSFQTPPAALGLVILMSVLIGMVIAGLLCSVELLALFMQNKSLKRRVAQLRPGGTGPNQMPIPAKPKVTPFKSVLDKRPESPEPKTEDKSPISRAEPKAVGIDLAGLDEDDDDNTGSFSPLK